MGGREALRASRVPQVVQTSAMDCGPAVLTALLRGHGLDAGLEAVRDLCATGVDGTSIDVMTDLAVELGLRASQRVVPVDHLGSKAAGLLPAVVVTELPDGLLHFVVLWRRVGRWVMVMDPAIGRRWLPWDRLRRDLYVHQMAVGAAAWRDYAGTVAFTGPLRENLSACGFDQAAARRMVDEALADQSWESVARLDAAARRGVRLKRRREEVVGWATLGMWEDLQEDAMVTPAPVTASAGTGEELLMRGAVTLCVDGRDESAAVPEELTSRVLVQEASPVTVLADVVGPRGARHLGGAAGAVVAGSAASISAVYLLQQLVDSEGGARLGALAPVAVLLTLASAAVAWGTSGVLDAGRWVEVELRRRIEDRVGRFPDRFFTSRPASDLAQRAHELHRLRELSTSLTELCTAASQLLVGAVLLVVVVPSLWWAVAALVAAATVVPFAFGSRLVEHEHRSLTIAGGMSHTYLDALVGALPVRAHRGGPAVTYEHRQLLDRWTAAERARHRLIGASTAATFVAGYLCGGLVVVAARPLLDGSATGLALVAFLAFVIVTAGVTAAATLRRLAPQWVVAQRLLALAAVDLHPPPEPLGGSGPVGIELRGVRVDGDRDPLLDDVSLVIRPGERVALVGASGAGKSTLVATILGWVEPDQGQVLLDGRPLDAAVAGGLRESCAWVDPDLAIWSGSFSENLRGDPTAVAAAGLERVVAVAGGFDSQVGEDGRLLSGGEAQRLRIARGMGRADARLVVLDEAYRGLDRALLEDVRCGLTRRFESVTTLAVTHDLDEACSHPRVVVMQRGRIVADGAPKELLADPTSAFAAMVADEGRLRDTLNSRHGWGSAYLDAGHLSVQPTTPVPPPYPPSRARGSESRQTPAEAGPDTADRPPRHGTAGDLVADAGLAALAVAAMAAEWVLFVTGWSGALSEGSGAWWAPVLVGAGLAAGAAALLLGLAGTRLGARLRRRLLKGGIDAPLERIRRIGSGDLLGRVLESDMFQQHCVQGGTDLAMGVVQIVAALAVLGLGDGPPAVAALIAVWLLGLAVAASRATATRSAWTAERVERTRLLLARFRGRRTESVYGPPPRAESRHLRDYWDRSRDADRWRALLLCNPEMWLAVAVTVTVAAAPPDQRLVGLAAVVLSWSAFSSLGVALDEVASAAGASSSFRVLLSAEEQPRTAADRPELPITGSAIASTPALVDVSIRQRSGGPSTLDRVSLRLMPCSRTVLRGDSGSGKTTLGLVLAGLRDPDEGETCGSGSTVYVPQYGDNHVFQSSLAFNLLMGREWLPRQADLDDATELLVELGLGHLLGQMPRGLAQPVGEAGWQLSHGERSRVHLARALLQGGHTVVMDEPLEGLDPATARSVIGATVARFPTIVLIDHS